MELLLQYLEEAAINRESEAMNQENLKHIAAVEEQTACSIRKGNPSYENYGESQGTSHEEAIWITGTSKRSGAKI